MCSARHPIHQVGTTFFVQQPIDIDGVKFIFVEQFKSLAKQNTNQ
jgi:hypothetical protein